jgi:outer membrane biosynthesis protein TonB
MRRTFLTIALALPLGFLLGCETQDASNINNDLPPAKVGVAAPEGSAPAQNPGGANVPPKGYPTGGDTPPPVTKAEEPAKIETPPAEPPKAETPPAEPPKTDAPPAEEPKAEPSKVEEPKA